MLAGTETLLVTDANGCTETEIAIVNTPLPISLAFAPINHAVCFGDANGNIQANPSGGVPPYTYLWNNGQTTQIATFLVAGSYTCTVTDVNGATLTSAAVVTQPSDVLTNLDTLNISCFGLNDGSAEVVPTGVTGANFTVSWNGLPPNNITFQPLPDGTYWVEVINTITGCSSGISGSIISKIKSPIHPLSSVAVTV